jgi:hypothetical protein
MRSLLRPLSRAAIVALTITLLLSALPSATFAAGPSITISGTGTGTCAAGPVASIMQGESFDVNLADFPIPVGSGVGILLTLPDGRLLDPSTPLPDVPTAPFYNLAQLPDFKAGPLISASFTYSSALSWPTGCYTVTATQRASSGVASPPPFLKATAQFRLLPKLYNAQSGNLRLWVQAAGTSQPTGQQPLPAVPPAALVPLQVNIFGQGVPATAVPLTVAISIVQPNGAIITTSVPPIVAKDGAFNGVYDFSNLHQPGMHTIYATVVVPSTTPATYTARAQFNLTAAPVTLTNNATLEMLAPFTALVPRGTPISIIGRKFISSPPASAPAPVNLILIMPNGVRLGSGATVGVDGNVPIGPFTLGGGFLTGDYRLVATQAAVGTAPGRTAAITWRQIP